MGPLAVVRVGGERESRLERQLRLQARVPAQPYNRCCLCNNRGGSAPQVAMP